MRFLVLSLALFLSACSTMPEFLSSAAEVRDDAAALREAAMCNMSWQAGLRRYPEPAKRAAVQVLCDPHLQWTE